MAKGQDAKKAVKKEPLKTAKEKKEAKREKKNASKRDWYLKTFQLILEGFLLKFKITKPIIPDKIEAVKILIGNFLILNLMELPL